jgi:hypothetical protein
MRTLGVVVVLASLAAGCGADQSPVVAGDPGQGDPTVYEAEATVLESPSHGPELCLSGVLDSYPPQCGGPPITNWDWEAVDDEESADGTTWGEYRVVGTYHEGRFTLTEPAGPPRREHAQVEEDRLATPCDEPAGGWHTVDAAKAGADGQLAATETARAAPDFAGLWLDQLEPLRDEGGPPGPYVLNVAFTGDLERHESELREHWGGPLCVTRFERSHRQLEAIARELPDAAEELELELLSWGIDEVANHAFADVLVAWPAAQRELDRRYGVGVVALQGRLRPVGDEPPATPTSATGATVG